MKYVRCIEVLDIEVSNTRGVVSGQHKGLVNYYGTKPNQLVCK